MLGSDWLKENKCVWDFGSGNLSINGYPAVTLTQKGHRRCRRVVVQEPVAIPPRSQINIPARMTVLSMKTPDSDAMIETQEVKRGIYVGRTLLPTRQTRLNICVANTTHQPQPLAAGTTIGRPVLVRTIENQVQTTSNTTSETDKTDILMSVMETLPSELSDEQRQQAQALLTEYVDIFSTALELHHDIRRLMALAHPKLAAKAREEIACDHFTAALNDSELTLKVKERIPRTLDEALRIALRLEAWAKTTRTTSKSEERNDRMK